MTEKVKSVFSGPITLRAQSGMRLERIGCRVEVAANGVEALARVESNSYTMVFMDCLMPEMDGYTATKEIRRRLGASLPIIAMTANVSVSDREECLSAGMDDFLAMPV